SDPIVNEEAKNDPDDLMVGGPRPGKPTTIAVISPALSSQYHVQFVEGAVEEGESYGWKMTSLAGDRETNFSAQVDLVESAVRKGVDAMTICAINDKAIAGAIEKANEKEIPVFIHNSLTELEGVEIQGYTGFNQRAAGRVCGEYAVKALTEKNGEATGTIYIITGIPGFHSNERVAGFREVVDKVPGIEIVGSGPGNWERLGGMNLAQTALKSNPRVDLIFAVSDAMAQGAAQAVQEAAKETLTLGLDGNPDTLQDIKNGVVTASLAVFPKEMGRIAIQNMKKFLDGEPIEKRNETPLTMIDRSNVDEYLN
ncbi:MAG: sugar ABC transporter substrate-binding protein, partial [Candidatus Omnitrophica bacterium]|nr:sugar ABC transporter substrate-binding protein [Candidatus Omnitrophota bacterium]